MKHIIKRNNSDYVANCDAQTNPDKEVVWSETKNKNVPVEEII